MSAITARRRNVRVPDPTPEEIETRAAEIRATWRSNDPRKKENATSYTLPTIASRHLTSVRPFLNRNI